MTHDLWESLNDTVLNFLAGVTLADLVQKQRAHKTQKITGPKSLLKVRPNNASRGRAGVETPLSVS
jgi:hypothetical protein